MMNFMDDKFESKVVDKARHCIGMDRRKTYRRHGKVFYRPYRNFYAVRTGAEEPHLEWLVSEGFALKSVENYSIIYWLTRSGLDWLGQKLNVKIYNEDE